MTHQDIDDPEVLVEPVAHKLDPILQKIQEFEVAGLEGGQVLGAHGGVQVTWLDARELGQVIHNLRQNTVIIFAELSQCPGNGNKTSIGKWLQSASWDSEMEFVL